MNLTAEEKTIQRKKWREANKKKKDKKQSLLQKENEEKLKKRREFRAALYKSKLKSHNDELRKKVTDLNRKIIALQKKIYRCKKINQRLNEQLKNQSAENNLQTVNTPGTTPLSKTTSFIDSLSAPIPDMDKNKIKKKIFELNVLSDSLKSQYNIADTNETKAKLKSIAENDITAKYNMKTNFTQKLGLKGRIRRNRSKNLYRKLEQDIKFFFLRDDISRSTAGRNETRTLNKMKMQKRFLTDTLDNLYKKYKSEGGKGSRTTFGRYRPFYIISPNVNDRNTCLCTKHTNLQFKADKLKTLGVITTNSLSQLVKDVVCDCHSHICMYSFCEVCKDKMPNIKITHDKKETRWHQWILKNHEYVKGKPGSLKTIVTKRYAKAEFTGTVATLVKKFQEELHLFKRHYFNIATQASAFKFCKETIKEDEIVIICDFSENYTCKLSEEIQSAHFGASKNQFSLHTGVIYLKGSGQTSFCTISPSICHDPGAIWAHLTPIIAFAKEKCLTARVIHFFSDGPSTQYRQKKNFYLFNKFICESVFDYGTWSFFEAAHGKGPADGVGGAIKRRLDKLVAYKHDIPSAETAYTLLTSQETEVKIFYIPIEDITKIQNTILDDLIPLPGTVKVHQVIVHNCDESILYRDVSCFCDFNNRGLCKCYYLKKHQLIRRKEIVTKKRSAKDYAKRNKSSKKKDNMDSTDTELDSDVTYAETSESEEYNISEDSSEGEKIYIEVPGIKEKLKVKQIKKENTDREITKSEEMIKANSRNIKEKENIILESTHHLKTTRNTNINILNDIEVVNVLDEKTGQFILKRRINEADTRSKVDEAPKTGNFVLVKFYTKHSRKIYRYVCLIEDIYGDSIVVKGLKSKKSKTMFRIVEDDISIIGLEDIIKYLPHPRLDNEYYIFKEAIDVNEA